MPQTLSHSRAQRSLTVKGKSQSTQTCLSTCGLDMMWTFKEKIDIVWFVRHFCSLGLFLHPTYQPPLCISSSFLPFCILSDCSLSFPLSPLLCSCQIDWHKGKDVTVKTIKKKQKHKGRGTVRTVTKQVPNDSFFNFFNPVKGENTQNKTLTK